MYGAKTYISITNKTLTARLNVNVVCKESSSNLFLYIKAFPKPQSIKTCGTLIKTINIARIPYSDGDINRAIIMLNTNCTNCTKIFSSAVYFIPLAIFPIIFLFYYHL